MLHHPGGAHSLAATPADLSQLAEPSRSVAVWRLLLPTLVLVAAYATFSMEAVPIRQGAVFFTVGALACLAAVFRANPERALGVGFVYLVLTVLFNGGLLFSIAFGAEPFLFDEDHREWLMSDDMGAAAVIATTAVAVIALTYLILSNFFRSALRSRAAGNVAPPVGPVAFLMVAGGTALWFREVIASGASLGDTEYSEFTQLGEGSLLPIAYIIIGLGMALAGAVDSRKWRWATLAFFVLFALPAFAIGIRGNIVIPVACHLVAAARRRRIEPSWRWLVVLVGALAGGALVKAIRNVQSGDVEGGLAELANPMNGLNELGYSIRPTGLVRADLTSGMIPTGADVYLEPVRRFFLGTIMGLDTASSEESLIAFNAYVRSRAGEIGGTPIAEALRAFDYPGMLWVMAAIALALAILDALPVTKIANAAVALYSYPLFLWVRNDFTPVTFQVTAATVLLLLVVLLSRRTESPEEAHQTPSPRAVPVGTG